MNGLVEEVLQAEQDLPALAIIREGLGVVLRRVGVVHLHHGEEGTAGVVDTLVLERSDGSGQVGLVAGELLDTPGGVDHVAHVVDGGADLEVVGRAADTESEILGDAEVHTVHPRSAAGVSLGILALGLAQVSVVVDEGPEGVGVSRSLEGDLVLGGRDVDQVGGVAVAVHIVGVDVAVAIGGRAGIERIEVQALTTEDTEREEVVDTGDHLIREDILGTLQTAEVGTADGRHAGEHGVRGGAGHTGDLLGLSVRVSEHELEVLDRLGVDREVEGVTPALVGVGHRVHREVGVLVVGALGIVDTVVRTVESSGKLAVVEGQEEVADTTALVFKELD